MPKPAKSLPQKLDLIGKYCRLEPLNEAAHTKSLWLTAGSCEDVWKYLMNGPWALEAEFSSWINHSINNQKNRHYYAVIEQESGLALGALCLMDCHLENATTEIGGIFFSPQLQKTRIATEAVFLLSSHAFDLGYRRLQWKCDSKNEASKKAARRFGFIEEGTLLQHMIIKGRSRDTTFFAILDSNWPESKEAFENWLNENNFDADGLQKRKLEEFRN